MLEELTGELSQLQCGFRKGSNKVITILPIVEKSKAPLEQRGDWRNLLTDLLQAFDSLPCTTTC